MIATLIEGARRPSVEGGPEGGKKRGRLMSPMSSRRSKEEAPPYRGTVKGRKKRSS